MRTYHVVKLATDWDADCTAATTRREAILLLGADPDSARENQRVLSMTVRDDDSSKARLQAMAIGQWVWGMLLSVELA